MNQYRKGVATSLVIGIVAIVLIVVGVGFYLTSQKASAPQGEIEMPGKNMGMPAAVILNEQNSSGESGLAFLTEENGKVNVTLSLTGVPDNILQPAHIHVGSCPAPGAVKYPLQNVSGVGLPAGVGGGSVTVLDASLEQLRKELPLAINVHRSTEDLKTYVACGDITAELIGAKKMMVEDGGMMKKENGAMMGNEGMMGEKKIIALTGKNFAFSQAEIRVKKGDVVRIEFSSTDGFHDWVVDEFNAKTERVNTGGKTFVEFIADKVGIFEYYCGVGTHRQMGMVGKLIVEDAQGAGPGKVMQYAGAVLAGSSAPLLDFVKADYDAAVASKKLVVLYFYANWCPICKAEFPNAQAAFNELTLQNVVGFRVNYKDNQTDSDEETLARQFGVAYQHTKVFIKGGKSVLKAPDSWDKARYLTEIMKTAQGA